MTDQKEQQQAVLRKLSRAKHGETVCLADWEIKLLVDYINDTKKRKAEEKK